MKQHITKEQWDELNNPRKLEFLPIMSKTAEIGTDSYPNIGEMIEFLYSRSNEIAIGNNDSGVFWTVAFGKRGTGSMLKENYYGEKREDKLCDALWDAVKYKLTTKQKTDKI